MIDKTPSWIKPWLTKEEIQHIEKCVELAESKTTGEIVPVIVRRSVTSGHVPLIVGLICTTILLALDDFVLNHFEQNVFYWLGLISFMGLAMVLTFLSSRSACLLRWLTSAKDLAQQVERRAINEFYNQRVHRTQRSTGILIFISLDEHRAVVIGDDPVSDLLKAEDWNGVIHLLLQGMRDKKMYLGFQQAIAASGELLSRHFPVQGNNPDELSNKLLLLD